MPLAIEQFLTASLRSRVSEAKGTFEVAKATRLLLEGGDGSKLGLIDVVLEGGGVKGIATVGALWALEELGLRFRKVAGTSAGAINAVLLFAAGQKLSDRRSVAQLEILANLDFFSFVDGGWNARQLVKAMNEATPGNALGKVLSKIKRGALLLANAADLIANLGLNPGNKFREFMRGELQRLNGGVDFTVFELRRMMSEHRQAGQESDFAIIASDVSHAERAVLPRDLHLYVKNEHPLLMSDFVRASMSIPIFFEPFTLDQFTAAYNLLRPPDTTFVDGGLVSNFPLAIFDAGRHGNTGNYSSPRCPTFGLLIDEEKGTKPKPKKIGNLIQLGKAIFQTATDYGDKAYIHDSPHAKERIIRISNEVADGRKVETTDFDLKDADKIRLFENGVDAALERMKTWDFDRYITTFRT
jgi:NTE family protein